jgi:hypothetical protein
MTESDSRFHLPPWPSGGPAGSVLVHCPQVFNLSGVTSIRPVSSAVILIAYDNVDCNCG